MLKGGGGGGRGMTVRGPGGQNKKKICTFHKFHRITHQSDGKQQSTAAPLIRRAQLLGSGLSGILFMDNKL